MWVRFLCSYLMVLAAMAFMNPGNDVAGAKAHLRTEAAGARSGVRKVALMNAGVFSLAHVRGTCFVGAWNTWLEAPCAQVKPLLTPKPFARLRKAAGRALSDSASPAVWRSRLRALAASPAVWRSRLRAASRWPAQGARWAWHSARFAVLRFPVDAALAANVGVFLLWQLGARWRSRMRRHCTASIANVRAGRLWCVLAASFSHAEPWHGLVNLSFLYAAGPPIVALGGGRSFWLLWLGGGAAAAALSLALHARLHPGVPVECLGASGSLFALSAALATLQPALTLRVNGSLSLSPQNALVLRALLELAMSGGCAQTDVIGHIGGALFGRYAALSGWVRWY